MNRLFVILFLFLVALFAVACGSDDDQQQQAASTTPAPAVLEQQQAAQEAPEPAQPEQPERSAPHSQPQQQEAPAEQTSQDDGQQPGVAEQAQPQSEQTSQNGQSSAQPDQSAALRSFIDDRGTEFATDSDQLVVIAEASVAAALLEFGVTLSGVFGQLEDAEGNPYGGADFSGLQSVGGDAYGEISLEALAELAPDVVVTISWGPDSYWWINPDLVDEIVAIAPLLLIDVSTGETGIPAPQVIARLDELSVVLGGAGGSEASKAAFAAAEEAVRAAAAANPDITLMFASASTDTFYIADPPAWPDLSYFLSLGIDVLRTETTEGGYWEYLSLESIDKYDVDHILLDDRDPGQAARLQADVPLWATLPAVQAGQISL